MSLDEIRALDVSKCILLVEEKEILDARLNALKENPHAQSSWEEMKERRRA